MPQHIWQDARENAKGLRYDKVADIFPDGENCVVAITASPAGRWGRHFGLAYLYKDKEDVCGFIVGGHPLDQANTFSGTEQIYLCNEKQRFFDPETRALIKPDDLLQCDIIRVGSDEQARRSFAAILAYGMQYNQLAKDKIFRPYYQAPEELYVVMPFLMDKDTYLPAQDPVNLQGEQQEKFKNSTSLLIEMLSGAHHLLDGAISPRLKTFPPNPTFYNTFLPGIAAGSVLERDFVLCTMKHPSSIIDTIQEKLESTAGIQMLIDNLPTTQEAQFLRDPAVYGLVARSALQGMNLKIQGQNIDINWSLYQPTNNR